MLRGIRDYRAEILAWLGRAEKCVNPPGGYYGNPSGDDLHPNDALLSACAALNAVVKGGSVADHVRIARALGLDSGRGSKEVADGR